MPTIVTTAATAEPIVVAEVKTHLNIYNEDHDTYLGTLIEAARRLCETDIKQTAIATTYEESYSCLPANGVLELTHVPVASVTSVEYYDSDGALQTLASTEYVAKTDSKPGYVLRAYEKTWPIVRSVGVARPVIVTYVAGYADAASVPQAFKNAMLLLIGHWWSVRESVAQVKFTEVPQTHKALLATMWHGGYP